MIAWAALIALPVVATVLFQRMSIVMALCLTMMGGYLFLPVGLGLNLPKLPTLDKTTITTLTVLVLTALAASHPYAQKYVLPGWLPRNLVVRLLLLALVCGVFGTVMTNRDTLVYGTRVLRGHTFYDAGSMLMSTLLILGPLFLGRKVLSSRAAQLTFLKVWVVFALGYSLLALWEVRMSPLLHLQIYGYFPSSFAQQMRASGFRPVVFLGHGLAVSLFFAMSTLAAAGLFRVTKGPDRWKWLAAVGWFFVVLVLSKSLGALLITLVLLPLILFFNTRMQMIAAVCIAGSILTYPTLRSANLVPVDQVLAFAASIGSTRAGSFQLRLENEERLLEKAERRPIFGWGGWGRSRVYTDAGFNITITDGSWVIELGYGGWFRYIGIFGLLCWPIIALFLWKRKKIDQVSVCLILLICAKLVDLIPNSIIGPITWLMAGALIGLLERPSEESAPDTEAVQNPGRQQAFDRHSGQAPQYARSFPKAPPKEVPLGPEVSEESPRSPLPYNRKGTDGGYRR